MPPNAFAATDLLFVYGTLRPGSGHRLAARLTGCSTWLGPGRMRGTLLRVADYPGAIDRAGDEGAWIVGDVVRVRRPETEFRWIDAYEDFDPVRPDGSLFRRVIREVHLTDTLSRSAWVFLYNGDPNTVPRIPGGDFLRGSRPSQDFGSRTRRSEGE